MIGDVRPVTLGWRKETASPIGLDMSFSPVLGSRSIGNTIFGKQYFGFKPMAGLIFAINEDIDIEFAYEPVIHIFDFSGSDIRNKTYHDFSVYVVRKKFSLIKELVWHSTTPQDE